MTNEEKRIKCADILGWDTTKRQLGGVFVYHDPSGNIWMGGTGINSVGGNFFVDNL